MHGYFLVLMTYNSSVNPIQELCLVNVQEHPKMPCNLSEFGNTGER